jgi:hypothetical protein
VLACSRAHVLNIKRVWIVCRFIVLPFYNVRLKCVEVELVVLWTGQASRAISTARLRMLPFLHLQPINVLVSNGPSEGLPPGKIRLEGGFPLRCFQRFSGPNIATRRCHWHDSRYTRGQSVPVLSY